MPLFDGVPFIVETPEQSMRADRPAVRNYLSALQSGMALKQRRDEAAQESAYRESVLKQRQSEFQAESPLRDLQRQAEVARIENYRAAKEVEQLQRETILKEATDYAEDMKAIAPTLAQINSARNLKELNTVQVAPLRTKRAADQFDRFLTQKRLGFGTEEGIRLKLEQTQRDMEWQREVMRMKLEWTPLDRAEFNAKVRLLEDQYKSAIDDGRYDDAEKIISQQNDLMRSTFGSKGNGSSGAPVKGFLDWLEKWKQSNQQPVKVMP